MKNTSILLPLLLLVLLLLSATTAVRSGTIGPGATELVVKPTVSKHMARRRLAPAMNPMDLAAPAPIPAEHDTTIVFEYYYMQRDDCRSKSFQIDRATSILVMHICI
ncbi:hypothetical protein H6P81_000723 [Aristolochia fimbriata]|uniref:Uncharacterized protein n=1 Tax=Aristolochia fimbriata TaxID=158543 RepID=A0AAV7F4X3_ARIFI|nr:hypothetical protein H6P81_000723 [Aristolochia fimbriata]